MKRLLLIAVVGSCVLAVGCGSHASRDTAAVAALTTTATAPPVDQDALKELLLSSDQINSIMEATDMRVTQRRTELLDDSDTMEPRECLAVDGAGQALVYANTGYTAVRGQTLREGDEFDHYVDQVVVLFPSAGKGTAFFDIQSELWPSCHRYTHTQSGSEWVSGPISDADGILSVTANQENPGNDSRWACGRALAVRNNVVIDVNTCSADPKNTATEIAGQIAGRVRTQ